MYTIPVYSVRVTLDGDTPRTELAITGSMPIEGVQISSPDIAARLISDIPECICSLNLILLVLDADDNPVRVCCAKDAAIEAGCLTSLFGFVGRSGHRVIIAGERGNGTTIREHHIERIQKLTAAAAEMDVVMMDYILVDDDGTFVSMAAERTDLELAGARHELAAE